MPPFPPQDSCRYRIRLHGHLDPSWARELDGMTLTLEIREDGVATTLLEGALCDQAALHGVLRRLQGLGLVLLLVERLEDPPSR